MQVEIVHVADCPGLPLARQRLTEAAAPVGRLVTIRERRIASLTHAAQLGVSGSPTILLDGVDPFTGPAAPPSLACRLYRTPTGLDRAPTVDQFVEALN